MQFAVHAVGVTELEMYYRLTRMTQMKLVGVKSVLKRDKDCNKSIFVCAQLIRTCFITGR
jgi:hypothetical protein